MNEKIFIGDVAFMDNLEPLLERWRAPVSIATFAPRTDFITAVKGIIYYR